jgi:hypothetical protein
VIRLRWAIVGLWVLIAVAATTQLPAIEDAHSGALGALIPRNAEAVKAEIASKTQFGFPLLSRTLIVQRDRAGLHRVPGFERIAAALPVTNAVGTSPYARERSTTAIMYLFFGADVSAADRVDLARRFADAYVPATSGGTVGVTGQAAAASEQSDLVVRWLPVIELATLLLAALAVGVRSRAVGAPLMTLLTVAIAYLISNHVVAWIGQRVTAGGTGRRSLAAARHRRGVARRLQRALERPGCHRHDRAVACRRRAGARLAVLHGADPELLASLGPIDPNREVPWSTVAARVEPGSHELLMAIEIDAHEDVTTVLVVRLSLIGTLAPRVIARFGRRPTRRSP